MLKAVERLEMNVIVDNTTDSLSTVPSYVESEFSYLKRNGMRVLSGRCICCASHGLSCLIAAHQGNQSQTLLFDAGPEAGTFERNVDRLGLHLERTGAVVLSHGHWDHTGGILKALDLIRGGDRTREITLYAHPNMFRSRARQLPNGEMLPMEDVPSIVAMTEHGANVIASTESLICLKDMFYVSGEIPRVTPFEQGLPFHFQKSLDGSKWEADPWIVDERWLGVHVADKGLVVFTACSHAGVINVLENARTTFPDIPLYAVVGGLHLSGPTEKLIPETVRAMKGFGLKAIVVGHCTGWRAVAALSNAFGDKVLTTLSVGKRFTF